MVEYCRRKGLFNHHLEKWKTEFIVSGNGCLFPDYFTLSFLKIIRKRIIINNRIKPKIEIFKYVDSYP